MRPIKLVMTAFGAYGGRVVLDFGELGSRNFFLITGPTGAGKTTILDAICFALYGDTSGEREAKSIRSDHAVAELLTEVEFTFSIGCCRYRVCRRPEQERPKKRGDGMTLQAATAQLWKLEGENDDKLLADSTATATRQAEKLLGFKSSQFRQVVLLPQGEFKRLLTADSVEREKIMQTLFQTEQYAAIERYFKEQARLIRENGESRIQERDFILRDEGLETSAALQERLENLCGKEKELAAALETATAERQSSRQALDKGRQDELKRKEYLAADAEFAKLEEKQATVDEYRGILQWAQRARLLDDAYVQLRESDEAAVKARQNAQNAVQELHLAAERYKQQHAVYQTEQERESERRQLAVRVSRFADWLQKAAELEKEEIKLSAMQQTLTKQQEQFAILKKQSAAIQAQQQSGQQRLLELTDSAAVAERLEIELQQLQRADVKFADAAAHEAAAKARTEELAALEQEIARLQHEYDAKGRLSEKLNRLFIEGQAARLAGDLSQGTPCPVCGSTQHPQLAVFYEALPSEEELRLTVQEQQSIADALFKAVQAQAAQQTAQQSELRAAQELINEAVQLSTLKDRTALAQQREMLTAKLTAAQQRQRERLALEKEMTRFVAELAKLEATAAQVEQAIKKLENELACRQGGAAAAYAAMPEEYRDIKRLRRDAATAQERHDTAARHWQEVQEAYQRAVAKMAAVQEQERQAMQLKVQAEERLQHCQTTWLKRLHDAGFADEAAYKAMRRPADYLEKLSERIAAYDKARQSAADRRQRFAAAALLPPVNLVELEQVWQSADALYTKRLQEHGEAVNMVKKLSSRQERLLQLERELAKIGEEYGLIGHLADVANGKNAYGVTFQRYVLGNLLDEVADAASLRLKRMSRGRYQLQRTDEKRRKNAQSGLELEVFDYYTGVARAVSTLSGGESFLASLALSLGLADVVQSYAGGIRLDTILVDEGFGTLDPESLDMALKTLIDLQAGGRLVGIISHVPELKERIDARLEVTLTKQGSTARFVV